MMMDKTKKQLLLLFVYIWYLLNVKLITPIVVKYLFTTNTLAAELFAELLSVGLPVSLAYFIFKKYFKFRFLQKSEKYNHRGWIFSFGIVISYFITVQYLINGIKLLYIFFTENVSIIELMPDIGFTEFLFIVFVYSILPGLYEEILYRGLYYDAYNDEKFLIYSTVSSVLFASAHADVMAILNALFLGYMLMYVYIKSQTLALPILLHISYNFLSLLFSNVINIPFSALNVLYDYANKRQILSAVFFSFGMSLLFATVLIIFFSRFKARCQTTDSEKIKKLKKPLANIIITIILLILATINIASK